MFTSSSFFDRIDYGEDIMKYKVLFFSFLCFTLLGSVSRAEISARIYTIESSLGKVLEVGDEVINNGTNIQINEYTGSDGQKWKFTNVGDGYYTITSVADDSKVQRKRLPDYRILFDFFGKKRPFLPRCSNLV